MWPPMIWLKCSKGRQIAADALITLRLHPPPGGAAEGGAYLRYGLQVKITEVLIKLTYEILTYTLCL